MPYEKKPYKKGPWQKKDAKPAYQSQRGKLSPLMTDEQKQSATIQDLSYDFACRITRLYKYLNEGKLQKADRDIIDAYGRQLIRSASSIAANVREAQHAQSDADFLSKMQIAHKECDETRFWISLLNGNGFIQEIAFASLDADVDRQLRILSSIVKSTKEKIERSKEKKNNP